MGKIIQLWEKLMGKNRFVFVLLACILFTFAVDKIIVKPIQEKTEAWQVKKQASINKYRQLQIYNISESAYEKLRKEEQEKVEILEIILPNELDQLGIVAEINSSIKKENLQVESIKPIFENENKKEYSAECKAYGDYFSWLNWLKKVQTQSMVNIKIHSINVDEQGKLSVAMQVVYYALK